MKPLLTKHMLSLIKDIIITRSPQLIEISHRLASGSVTNEERKKLIILIAEELCEKGFDADSEPTVYGLELEELIDLFNRPNLKKTTLEIFK